MIDRRRLRLALALLLLAVPAVVMAVRFSDYAVDDFFITYRYAANLAAGDGLTFNPGERVFGTTAAGHALLLAALAAASGAAMTHVGTVITLAAKLGLAVLVYLQARRSGYGAEALVGGLLLLTHPFLWLHNGAEGHPVLALLAVAATVAARRPATAGGIAAYAAWCRPDAALGLGLLGLHEWVRTRRLPWRYGVTGAAVLAAGLAAARLWFGRFLPATLEAKRAQAEGFPAMFPSGGDFWPVATNPLVHQFAGPALVPVAVLALCGLPLLLRRGGVALRVLTLYAATLSVAYPLLGVPLYPWYLIPMLVVGVYGVCFAAGGAGRAAWRFFGATRPAAVVGVVLALLLLAPFAAESARRTRGAFPDAGAPPRLTLYRQAGAWLQAHTPPDRVVATIEVGGIGFYSDRPIHDLLALVTPAALPEVRRGDLAAAFHAGEPDLFVVYSPHRPLLSPILEDGRFNATLCPVVVLPLERVGQDLTIYGRLPRPPETPCVEQGRG